MNTTCWIISTTLLLSAIKAISDLKKHNICVKAFLEKKCLPAWFSFELCSVLVIPVHFLANKTSTVYVIVPFMTTSVSQEMIKFSKLSDALALLVDVIAPIFNSELLFLFWIIADSSVQVFFDSFFCLSLTLSSILALLVFFCHSKQISSRDQHVTSCLPAQWCRVTLNIHGS